METGTIIKGIGGFYYISVGSKIYECRARGIFRKQGITPMVGDKVNINNDGGFIEEILPRKNSLVRPAVSNIDSLGIVIAAKEPEPDFLLVDKLMISAEWNNITPFLIINKIDLSSPPEVENIINSYSYTNYSIYMISTKECRGIEQIYDSLSKGVTTFAGQSGVGKSSLLNLIIPQVILDTGNVSNKIKRGRHTTRHVELLPLPCGGMVVDTPGFSSLEISDIPIDEIKNYYPEFRPYNNQCKFAGCTHNHEPQCKIKELKDKGAISEDRYNRYLKIIEDIKKLGRDVW